MIHIFETSEPNSESLLTLKLVLNTLFISKIAGMLYSSLKHEKKVIFNSVTIVDCSHNRI